MPTCFLFASNLDQTNCYSLRLNPFGQLDAPLQNRTIEEFLQLQENTRTVVIFSSQIASFHQVELPRLGESKARAALPFAIEDEVAQQTNGLHLAFDKANYLNGAYLVSAISKSCIHDLMTLLQSLSLRFDKITLDWFALHENEITISKEGLLVNTPFFKGYMGFDLLDYFLETYFNFIGESEKSFFYFSDTPEDVLIRFKDKQINLTKIEEPSGLWIAQRLWSLKPLDLCQGEYLREDTSAKRWWFYTAVTSLPIIVLSVLLSDLAQLYFFKKVNNATEQKIAAIYYDFFPQATQVISPQFRISSLLAKGESEVDPLWLILDKLTANFQDNLFTIEEFRYQNNVLTLTILSNDFAELENLQAKWRASGLQVTQTQAASRDQRVLATLDLKL
jgi:general secretion pathway protein L